MDQYAIPPEPKPEAGWTPISTKDVRLQPAFLQPDARSDRTRVQFYTKEGVQTIYAKAWFGPGAAGGPGIVHGGAAAAVLDEVMGVAAWFSGHVSMTGTMTIKYRLPMPVGIDTTVEGWMEQKEGRKVYTKGRIVDSDNGQVYVEGEAVFIRLSDEYQQLLRDAEEELNKL
jgi:acyl-coenzyme A thioesterase PaaI-like protein